MCILFVYTLLKVVNYYDFEYFVFERALAIATLLLQMKNSEHVYIINSVYCLSGG